MIVVKYEEEQIDVTTGTITSIQLGIESHQDIVEVLLPNNPSANDPIFFTKKFQGNTEYRWEVISVSQHQVAMPCTYIVKLRRRKQVDKKHYLKNILTAQPNNAAHVLHQWAIVEVEFGHALTIGKENGNIRSNKRYADTIQHLSMPKRRLAIVIQVHLGRDELVQVIPISSKQPRAANNSIVEVTSCLTDMEHYQKPSWAICNMIQTVTASRIIAPMIKKHPMSMRDTRFRTLVRGAVRDDLKDAIMHGVAASGRISAARSLTEALADNKKLMSENALLTKELESLKLNVKLYEEFASDMDVTMEYLHATYGN